jgi:beta-barrel assembly-enhancing protease
MSVTSLRNSEMRSAQQDDGRRERSLDFPDDGIGPVQEIVTKEKVMKKVRQLLPILIAVAFLPAAPGKAGNTKYEVDKIGNRHVARRNLVPQTLENRMGKLAAARLERSNRFVQDQEFNRYVNRIANKVASNSDLGAPVTVKIIDSSQFDAFSLPGGFLYVTTGLLRGLDSEGELAAALAHEIAHLAARHSASHVTRRAAIDAVGFLPFGTAYAIATSVPQASLPLALAKFSRGQELKADYLGLQYVYKSGYDPKNFVGLLQKVQRAEEEVANKATLGRKALRNHPLAEERIRRAQDEIKEILSRGSYTRAENSEFDSLKQRLLATRGTNEPVQQPGVTTNAAPLPADSGEGAPVQITSNEQVPAPLQGESAIDFTPPILEHNDLPKGSQSK